MKIMALLLFCLLVACQSTKNVNYEPPIVYHSPKNKIILVTIDGTRWQEIFSGTDPNLTNQNLSAQELTPYIHFYGERGIIIGEKSSFIALGPNHVSLPGYLEIMRGRISSDCLNNDCIPNLEQGTIPDLFDSQAVFSSWDRIKRVVSKNSEKMIINCGMEYRSNAWDSLNLTEMFYYHPDFSYDQLYRSDDQTAGEALKYFNKYHPDFLWVALGNTDEYAHAGDYDKYLASLKYADYFIGDLIANMTPDYTIIVSTDHGRNTDWRNHGEDSESAKVWLMMYGNHIPNKGSIKLPILMSLSNIKPTIEGIIHNQDRVDSLLH